MPQDYIDALRRAMWEQDLSPAYISLCCRYARDLLDRGLPVLFDEAHVRLVLRMGPVRLRSYHTFYVQGQSGKIREICAPSRPLKLRQRWVLDEILSRVPVSPAAHGFVRGRSIVTNAMAHMGQESLLCLDIRDFFPSISQDRVLSVFRELGYAPGAARALADLCCFRGALPQGAPTSPALANAVCRPMDGVLEHRFRAMGLRYTRYADDITLSGAGDLSPFLPEAVRVLSAYGFQVNRAKTRLLTGSQRKLVTGLLVEEDRVRVPKAFKRRLRQEIHYCSRFGVSAHLENSGAEKYVNYREHLYGKAYFIHMVEPEAGEAFLRQLDQLDWPEEML